MDAGSPVPTPAPDGRRDAFLDVVRAAALTRVLLWHATGLAALTWLAAMPVMFAIAGLLAARSLGHRSARLVLRSRLRRLLLPFWAYAATAWALMLGTAATKDWPEGHLAWWHPLTWVVPLVDPVGSPWGAALWGPLWYLRTFVCLLLVSPLLLVGARARPRLLLVASVGLLGASEVVAAGTWWWPAALRDGFHYLPCWVAGAVVAVHGWPTRRQAAAMLGVGAGAAAAIAHQAGAVVLNTVPLAEVAGGAAVAGAALLARARVTAVAEGRLGPAVRLLTAFGLTAYLWHAVGWLVHREVVPTTWPTPALVLSRLVVVLAVVALAVVVVGRLELEGRGGAADGHRWHPGRWVRRHLAPVVAHLPRRTGTSVAGALLAASLVVAVVTDTRPLAALAPPSGRFLDAQAARFSLGLAPATTVERSRSLDRVALDAALSSWWASSGWSGVAVEVRVGTSGAWSGALGTWSGEPFLAPGSTMAGDVPFGWGSMTKTVTTRLVMEQVGLGTIQLDAPLATIDPQLPHAGQVTPRQLLGHRSGLADTQLPQAESLALTAGRPLLDRPGRSYRYADANYHALALVLERVTGQPYAELVATELDRMVGPERVRLQDPVAVGRGAAGGLRGDLRAVADTFHATLGPRQHDPQLREMTALAGDSSYGLGVAGHCPCWLDDDGGTRAASYGHPGWYSYAAHWPASDLTVAVLGPGGSGTDFLRYLDVADLLVATITGEPIPAG